MRLAETSAETETETHGLGGVDTLRTGLSKQGFGVEIPELDFKENEVSLTERRGRLAKVMVVTMGGLALAAPYYKADGRTIISNNYACVEQESDIYYEIQNHGLITAFADTLTIESDLIQHIPSRTDQQRLISQHQQLHNQLERLRSLRHHKPCRICLINVIRKRPRSSQRLAIGTWNGAKL